MKHRLERRVLLILGLGLLGFALLAGSATYAYLFARQMDEARTLQQQLVKTVYAQAQVAAFASNQAIAEGVIDGLLANPVILGVRVVGNAGFTVSGGRIDGLGEADRTTYPLMSPTDGQETIGHVEIYRNVAQVEAQARSHARIYTLLLLLELAFAAVLMVLVIRHWISRPVIDLAEQLSTIVPGSGKRVAPPPGHLSDELGVLAGNINTLLGATEEALEMVKALAITDPLTGLPNRRHFMERLSDESQRVQRYADLNSSVLMLDIDHFKQVNDRHGHATGDVVLRHVAARIQAAIRKVDTPGRLGGEEFAILLPGTPIEDATALAERLRRSIEQETIETNTGTVACTVSIGIACLRKDSQDVDTALIAADKALYCAKHNGRNRVERAPEPPPGPTKP